MSQTAERKHPGRRAPRSAVAGRYRGSLVAVWLAAIIAAVWTGGVFEEPSAGEAAERAETPKAHESAVLATVQLRVEGMVCYG